MTEDVFVDDVRDGVLEASTTGGSPSGVVAGTFGSPSFVGTWMQKDVSARWQASALRVDPERTWFCPRSQ